MKYDLLKGKYIRLTRPMDGDAEAMLKWYDDMEFMRNVDTDVAYPCNKEENEKVIKDSVSHEDFLFHIRPLDTDELLGFVALDGIEWNNGCCMMSIGIGEKKNRGGAMAVKPCGCCWSLPFLS